MSLSRTNCTPYKESILPYERFYIWLLVLWPILNIYGLFTEFFGIGDLLIVPFSLYLLIVKKYYKHKANYYSYFTFFLIGIGVSFLSILLNDFVNYLNIYSIARKLLYVFVFGLVAPKIIDIKYFTSCYKKVCIVLSSLLIMQFVSFYLFGFSKPLVIKSDVILIRDVDGYDNLISTWYYYLDISGFKPASIFSEAAKFAQYVTPCLVLSLFYTKKRCFYLFEILVSVALVMSKSANAVVFLAVSWMAWLLFYNKINTVLKIVLVISGIFVVYFVFTADTWISTRLNEIGQTSINSGNMRVLRGWLVFDQLPFKSKVVGVGTSNIAEYILLSGIKTPYDGGYIGYMSGLSEIACTNGFLGLFLFGILSLKYLFTNNSCSKALTILLIITISSSAILNTPTFGIVVSSLEAMFINSGSSIKKGYFYENLHHYASLH